MVEAPPPSHGDLADRVLVHAPRGRDGALVEAFLDEEEIGCHLCEEVDDLVETLPDGAGAVVLTEEVLGAETLASLRDALEAQPAWSDVPVLLFLDSARVGDDYLRARNAFGANRSLTLLERPVRRAAFVNVLRLALRARQQQYALRDLLGRWRALNGELQGRVAARTAALQQRNEEVEALAEALTMAEQRERARIAQLLHDDLQQLLYGLKLNLGLLRDELGDDQLLDAVVGFADAAIDRTRALTTELNPPVLHEDGLDVALRWVADHHRSLHGLDVTIVAPEPVTVPNRDLRVLLTHAVRELLFNVVKHSGVHAARLEVQRDAEDLILRVHDDGVGFDVAALGDAAAPEGPTGYGLAGMRERLRLVGGRFEVASRPDGGTAVTLRVPVHRLGEVQPSEQP